MARRAPRYHDDYTIGWISALPLEMAAAKTMLDGIHDDLPIQPTDHNTYILGNIKEHNIVIACLPSGDYGIVSANTVAMQLLSSFRSIRFGLMVGIGGGVPNSVADIRLGDVVVSKPTETYGGVVQYDYGKAMNGGRFQRSGMLSRPPQILLTALSKMQANYLTEGNKIADLIAEIGQKYPQYASKFNRPTQEDHLYHSDYNHIDSDSSRTCNTCDPARIVSRPARGHNEPLVHYGLIASANQLVRDSQLRNHLNRELGVYCVEMEAAGLMNNFRCLVIRGICDYADSHKNKEWQGYASAVAAAYAKELILCISMSDMDHARSAEDAASVRFSIPFNLAGLPAIENFLGRQKKLERLWHYLQPQTCNSRKVAILHGLGGIGKTQLAIRFARNHKDHFTAILWLRGKNRNALLQSLSSILPRLPGQTQASMAKNEDEVEQNARKVLKWLALPGNSRWLLIFDNVDNYSPVIEDGYDIREFFPTSDYGSILITSRLQSLAELGQSFPVPTFSSEEAISLLGQNRHLPIPDMISKEEVDQATNELINCLGGLPLAIAIAAAYMRETGTSIREYLQCYRRSWHDLQSRAKPGCYYQQGNLLQTWLISYDEIKKRNPNVAELMILLAHFDNRDIWYELVKGIKHSSHVPKWFDDVMSDILVFKDNIRTLIQFSLVEVNQQCDSYSIHPVVQDWCLDMARTQKNGLNCSWYELALIAIGEMVPKRHERDYWRLQQRLLGHTDFLRQVQKSDLLTNDIYVWKALLSLGDLYMDQDNQKHAETMYQQALEGYEKAIGPDHTFALIISRKFDWLYCMAGQLKEAETFLQRALAGYEKARVLLEKALGPDHPYTLDAINSIGDVYRRQRKPKEAETMYQRALTGYGNTLEIHEKTLGPDHPMTLETVNNIGSIHLDLGKPKEAATMFQRVLTGYEKVWGLDHVNTWNIADRLGKLYEDQGRLKEAEMMYQRALAGKEKALGSDHPSTLDTVNGLGDLYLKQKKWKEAETMHQRALAGFELALGPDHASTLTVVHRLGFLYVLQSKWKEADTMHQRALAARKKVLGPDHPTALDTVSSLGHMYQLQGKLKEAETMHQRALAGYEKVLGPDHPSTLDTVNSLGRLYFNQEKWKEAETMHQRALAGYEKVLGPDHRTTLIVVRCIAYLYFSQKKWKEAETMYRRALAGYEQMFDPDDIQTRNISFSLTRCRMEVRSQWFRFLLRWLALAVIILGSILYRN